MMTAIAARVIVSGESAMTVSGNKMIEAGERENAVVTLKDKERIDDLQRNGYRIIQHPGKFCFGMDAVLLSGFATARSGDRVLDLCTGTGIIPILMEAKTKAAHLTGLEIQEESADMARRSVHLNGLEHKVDILTGDVKEAGSIFASASFDVVTCNPPYMIGQHGLANPETPKAVARHEILCTLEDVVSQTARLLKPGGHFYLVHRPFRLAEIMSVLVQYRLEPKRMRLAYPYVDREPNMVLVEAVRGGKSRMTVEKPLIIFQEQGIYSEEIRENFGY
ncbi:MAG: tRNA1(Val) (adenine(37)-N6)-methyltransferase [Muribaculum sp.]|nr:tRNA1(Val) (adenine(37)-N6)-methyltransferase [Muribaculum sp.]